MAFYAIVRCDIEKNLEREIEIGQISPQSGPLNKASLTQVSDARAYQIEIISQSEGLRVRERECPVICDRPKWANWEFLPMSSIMCGTIIQRNQKTKFALFLEPQSSGRRTSMSFRTFKGANRCQRSSYSVMELRAAADPYTDSSIICLCAVTNHCEKYACTVSSGSRYGGTKQDVCNAKWKRRRNERMNPMRVS